MRPFRLSKSQTPAHTFRDTVSLLLFSKSCGIIRLLETGGNTMVAVVLFWAGTGIGVINSVVAYYGADNKSSITAVPFFLYAGAAVAHLLGL